MQNRPRFSEKKAAFLKSGTTVSYQLKASDYEGLITHFKEKHHIQLYLNGQTDIGQKMLAENLQKIHAVYDAAKQLNDGQELFKQSLLEDTCLKVYQVATEIEAIQKTLSSDDYVGYIHTLNHRKYSGHFEVFIIAKNYVIKPVIWNDPESGSEILSPSKINNLYMAGLYYLVLSEQKKEFKTAQANGIECGTLGLLYLKELLKENAKQLRELSFRLTFYDNDGELRQYFLPPPHVLRYSQSSLYNAIMRDIVREDKPSLDIVIPAKGDTPEKKYEVATLQGLLKTSLHHAISNGNSAMIAKTEEYLSRLPAFRNKWLQGYEEADRVRRFMDDKAENRYLLYASRRMEKKIQALTAAPPLKNKP